MLKQHLIPIVAGPPAFAFIPAFCLAAYWFGGEGALVVFAGMLPVLYLIAESAVTPNSTKTSAMKGIMERPRYEEETKQIYQDASRTGRAAAVFGIAIDDYQQVLERYGQTAADTIVQRTGDRIASVLRPEDRIALIGDGRFNISTEPVRHLDLELCIQLAGRLQAAVEEPISIEGLAVYVSVSIGFCQHRTAPGASGTEWRKGAAIALQEARRRGPSAIRAFSDQMRLQLETHSELTDEVVEALDSGLIHPWFQPQISTDTGLITGFEALARWSHPERGLISPADFLPAVEQAGQLERLAEVMMYQSFTALNAWDASGFVVPQVGVNFTGSELSNPKLLEKIQWELDRFDLSADRLAVEVLETVVASAPDDTITRNINALSKLGCRIDLDDFGTGHASITSIRRFSVSRIKIDRSFVMKADRDPEQQRMIGAILTMAERLKVETLAEGVETVGEHAMLAQLGCDHVQGFGIARPMPFDRTLEWMQQHSEKLEAVPRILGSKSL